jgi:DNA repair protein RecO (recombination protein O)
MIAWRDSGMVLTVRPHGEHAAIVELFTAEHGRHAGVVRGAAGRRLAPVLQPGAQVDATWRARLGDHIGAFTVEPLQSRSHLMTDRRALAGLNTICAILHHALPERAAHPQLYAATLTLLDAMGELPEWPMVYLRWEIGLLQALGFGLDLGACAVTGAVSGVAYVSPRTGRAVSRAAAGAWADRLFPLPACMGGERSLGDRELQAGLAITGHFLARDLADNQRFSEARQRLIGMFAD